VDIVLLVHGTHILADVVIDNSTHADFVSQAISSQGMVATIAA
jgi:hypothetical protein